jgi:hypothetical protein
MTTAAAFAAAAANHTTAVPGFNSSSPEFKSRMAQHNDGVMAGRGLDTCPTGCACDYLTRCGKPY